MSSQPDSRSQADAVYGDGELPGDADLVAPGADGGSAASPAAESAHDESTTNESTSTEEE
ncbi:hypothetical protein ACVXZ4_09530 [Lacisediminihabitans sp. FW035]